MRRHRIAILLGLFIFVLTGCQAASVESPTFGAVRLTDTQAGVEESGYWIEADLTPVETSAYSQSLRDGLAEEWRVFREISMEERLLSSHVFGHCHFKAEDWTEAVDFLGLAPENPLETYDWLERNGAVSVYYDGTEDGTVTSAAVWALYLDGTRRIQLIVNFSSEANYTTGCTQGQTETVSMENGNTALLITPQNTDRYCSVDAYFVQTGALYLLHVVDEAENIRAARDTMERLLSAF